jgi:hypothetical protein
MNTNSDYCIDVTSCITDHSHTMASPFLSVDPSTMEKKHVVENVLWRLSTYINGTEVLFRIYIFFLFLANLKSTLQMEQ